MTDIMLILAEVIIDFHDLSLLQEGEVYTDFWSSSC